MSITDELREWVTGAKPAVVDGCSISVGTMTYGCKKALLSIADRIDAEHEKATAGCIHYDPERHYCAVHGDTEHGWVKLPVDADGVPIHVGDKINVYQAKNVEVVGVGNQVVFTHYYMGDYHRHFAGDCRHHYPPTVEDVLEEMLRLYDRDDTELTNGEIVERYAAKLRLAGGVE